MMWETSQSKIVPYAYEHGDKTLPRLRDLLSKTLDPDKERIFAYLKTNCFAACPGIFHDEITPARPDHDDRAHGTAQALYLRT